MQKQIILNNLLIHYYEEGEGDTPFIFLHGWRNEAVVWQSIIRALCAVYSANQYTFYAIDLPGFGNSETPQTPFTLNDYAEIVKEFIRALYPLPSTPNLIIIGHSFGGRIAVKFAAEHPELIQKLILVDCGGTRESKARRTAYGALAALAKPFFTPRFMQPLRKKIYRFLGAEDYVATPELKETYLNILRESLEPLFPRIQTPTLILWGVNDTETPLTYGQKMSRAIPHSRFAAITNAGHFCFLDQPEKFLKILEEYIKE